MRKKERKLLLLAGALLVLVLLVRVGPMVVASYQEQQEDIALLRQRIERYDALVEETEQWSERAARMRMEVAQLDNWVFPGTSPNLIGSSVQRELRRAAEAASVGVREMSVARFNTVDGWLMVHQDMSFIIEQGNILKFLSLLEETRPRLFVTEFTITQNRRQFTGNITVTGFSRRDQ